MYGSDRLRSMGWATAGLFSLVGEEKQTRGWGNEGETDLWLSSLRQPGQCESVSLKIGCLVAQCGIVREPQPFLWLQWSLFICSARIKLQQLAIQMGDRLEDTEYLPALGSLSHEWLRELCLTWTTEQWRWLWLVKKHAVSNVKIWFFWWMSNLVCIFNTTWGLLMGGWWGMCLV